MRMENTVNLVNSDWLIQKNQGLSLVEENNVLQASWRRKAARQGPNWTSSARCWNKKNSSASEPNNFCLDDSSTFLPKTFLADNLAGGNGRWYKKQQL